MKVRALRTGFFGGRRRPGTVFDVPEDGERCIDMQITDAAVTPQPGITAPDGVGED